jgi:hypothetical protein
MEYAKAVASRLSVYLGQGKAKAKGSRAGSCLLLEKIAGMNDAPVKSWLSPDISRSEKNVGWSES